MPALYLRPGQRYYPAMLKGQVDFLDEIGAVPHTDVDLPLGRSRYGGCLLDLPPGVQPLPLDNPRARADFPTPAAAEAYRERAGFRFAAHLNFEELGPLDPTGRLPTTGQLYVYFDGMEDHAVAQYHDVPAETLVRHVVEHEWMFYEGVEIESAYWAEVPEDSDEEEAGGEDGVTGFRDSGPMTDEEIVEDLAGLMTELGVTREELEAEMAADAETDDDDDDSDGDGEDDEEWDDDWDEEEDEDDDDAFVGADESRVFGDFVHVQWSAEERAEAIAGKVVLLQIGEGDFNDEGVFSVLIDEGALQRRDFSGVVGYWAQT